MSVQQPTKLERRECVRHPYSTSVQVNNGKILSARAINLSCTGVGLEILQPLKTGFDLEVVFLNGVVKVPARVEYCDPARNKTSFRVGLRFENLEEDLVEALVQVRDKEPQVSKFVI
ncbi:MAG: PilZ domain-containing protein [Deltaproteobacteria bacterium]|nr:PilZ domain-containing protein [Deltaproteobacteria bacterium]